MSLLVVSKTRRLPRLSIDRAEAALLGLVALNAGALYLYMSTYPVFPPQELVHDYAVNLQMLSSPSLLHGWLTSSLWGVTQLTSALLMLYGVNALQGNLLTALRYSMVAVAAMAPFLVYYVSVSIFERRDAAVFATAAYCFVFPFWFYGVLATGLYAQFYAGLLFLMTLWLLKEYVSGKLRFWTLGVVSLLLPLAHPSSLVFLAVVSASCFFVFVTSGRSARRYLTASLVTAFPLMAGLGYVGPQAAVSFLTGLAGPTGGYGYNPDILSPFISSVPYVFVLDNFVGPVTIALVLLTAFVGIGKLVKGSLDRRYVPLLGWFFVPWVMSLPASGLHMVARYVIFALPACGLIFGLLFLWVLDPFGNRLQLDVRGVARVNRLSFFCVAGVILFIISLQGASGSVISMSVPSHGFTVSEQNAVLYSMLWLRSNAPNGSAVLSVGLPWYEFSPYFTNCSYIGDFVFGPATVGRYLAANGYGGPPGSGGRTYVVLFSLIHNSTVNFYRLYSGDSNYSLVWNSSMVAVFEYH